MDPEVVKTKFGQAVRNARAERGMSQERLALVCGLHRTYIGGIERGERNTSIVNIRRIAEALDMTAAELLAGNDL